MKYVYRERGGEREKMKCIFLQWLVGIKTGIVAFKKIFFLYVLWCDWEILRSCLRVQPGRSISFDVCFVCFNFWVLWNKFPLGFAINYLLENVKIFWCTLRSNPAHKQAEKHQVSLSFDITKIRDCFFRMERSLCSELMNTRPTGLSWSVPSPTWITTET